MGIAGRRFRARWLSAACLAWTAWAVGCGDDDSAADVPSDGDAASEDGVGPDADADADVAADADLHGEPGTSCPARVSGTRPGSATLAAPAAP